MSRRAETPLSNTGPIGVFDSGLGGLSVLRAIRALLPCENLLYVADSAHVPYGEKSPTFIEERCLTITEYLIAQGAKAIVVACNTATGAAVATLRARFTIPIIGMEPAVKPATQRTRTGVIGVLATRGTLDSGKFAGLLERFGDKVTVQIQPCPGLVERVENGDLASAETRTLVERYVTPLLEQGADTIVLGCTHYPFLLPLIQSIAGPGVTVLDPSDAIARELDRRLTANSLKSPNTQPGYETFWTTGKPQSVERTLSGLWGNKVVVMALSA